MHCDVCGCEADRQHLAMGDCLELNNEEQINMSIFLKVIDMYPTNPTPNEAVFQFSEAFRAFAETEPQIGGLSRAEEWFWAQLEKFTVRLAVMTQVDNWRRVLKASAEEQITQMKLDQAEIASKEIQKRFNFLQLQKERVNRVALKEKLKMQRYLQTKCINLILSQEKHARAKMSKVANVKTNCMELAEQFRCDASQAEQGLLELKATLDQYLSKVGGLQSNRHKQILHPNLEKALAPVWQVPKSELDIRIGTISKEPNADQFKNTVIEAMRKCVTNGHEPANESATVEDLFCQIKESIHKGGEMDEIFVAKKKKVGDADANAIDDINMNADDEEHDEPGEEGEDQHMEQ